MNREKRYQNRIAVRLSTEEKQQLAQLVKNGKYRNFSEIIRLALEEFLVK
jgi:Arc/MetJ-type ribon-helix-helix transcriptional regulator